jgi:hypothetical protein
MPEARGVDLVVGEVPPQLNHLEQADVVDNHQAWAIRE